jgi:serine O-acetyltransferase
VAVVGVLASGIRATVDRLTGSAGEPSANGHLRQQAPMYTVASERGAQSPGPLAAALARWRDDIRAAKLRDPAAGSALEITLTSPGLHAVWAYRLAHRIWLRPGGRLPARVVMHLVRMVTGVEIHPGATIGDRLFIDHGMGVVIGETAEIGHDVLLFHGVTLGGRSSRGGKRHPTLGDRVMVGAGARILGPVLIGHDSSIGANAVVVRDVPPESVATGVPARVRGHHSAATPYVDDPAMYI